MATRVAVRTVKPSSPTLTHQIADEAEPRITRAIRDAFDTARSLLNLSDLARFFADRWAARILDHQQWLRVLNPLYENLTAILFTEVLASARRHAPTIQKADGSAQFAFDLVNPEAVWWAETHAARLVLGVTEETRAAIRAILVRLYQDPTMGPDRAAREIRAIIGLTRRQALAVDNLRRHLERERNLMQQARQAETSLTPHQQAYWAAQADKTVTQIDRRVTGYADRLLRQRSQTIARTESMAASNTGQLLLWDRAKTVGLVDETVEREWIVAPDIRLCDLCEPMRGVRVPLDQPFTLDDGQQIMTPPAHPNCRCTTVLRFP